MEFRDFKDSKDPKDFKDPKDSKDFKDTKDPKGIKPPKNQRTKNQKLISSPPYSRFPYTSQTRAMQALSPFSECGSSCPCKQYRVRNVRS